MTTLVLSDLRRDQSASLARLIQDEPDALYAVFPFRVERREKPTIRDGKWTEVPTIVTLDAEGRVIGETFPEEIAP